MFVLSPQGGPYRRLTLLQLGVLLLQRLQPLGVGHLHAAICGLPVIQRRLRDPALEGHIARFRPRVVLAQTAMICSSVNCFLFICTSFKRGQTLIPTGGNYPWQVTARLGGTTDKRQLSHGCAA